MLLSILSTMTLLMHRSLGSSSRHPYNAHHQLQQELSTSEYDNAKYPYLSLFPAEAETHKDYHYEAVYPEEEELDPEKWRDDWLQLGTASSSNVQTEQHMINEQYPVDQLSGLDLDADVSPEEESSEDVNGKQRRREKKARKNLAECAQHLGSDLARKTHAKRFQDYANKEIIENLLSSDMHRREKATRSILLHRPSNLKFFNERLAEEYVSTNEPLYDGLTKEDIVNRLFEVMKLTPVEDVRIWWYDAICKTHRKDAFPKLFSNDRVKQEDAIKALIGLTRKGQFWVKLKRKKFVSIRS